MTLKSTATSLTSILFIVVILTGLENYISYGVSAERTPVDCRPEMSIRIKFPSELTSQTALLTLMPGSPAAGLSDRLLERIEIGEPMTLCIYIGVIESTRESFLAHVTKDGLLRSSLKYQGKWYKLQMPLDATNPVPAIQIDKVNDNQETSVVRDWSDISSHHLVCQGCGNSAGNPILHSRSKRDLKFQSFNQLATRRVLELIVVADSTYIAKFGQDGAISRILQMLPYVNGAYQPLGLQIVLVKIVPLTANQFNASQDFPTLFLSFNAFKAFNINGRHDAAILLVPNLLSNIVGGSITNSSFGGSVGGLCDSIYSGGIVADTTGPVQGAWLMVRAIGILLGFKFDETVLGCTCSESIGCFMDSRKSFDPTTQLFGWSSCSLDSWRSQEDATWRECLKDTPNASYAFPPATQCGNGIVDPGEQCDCGPALTCKSSCCDSNTCMFKAGAQCANGACCDSTTCKLKAKGQVCRHSDGSCDVSETCNGLTEWCPADDKVADGVQCDSLSYCYNGACKSSSNQCKMLYGPTATVADQVCFTTINTLRGMGYCTLNLIFYNATGHLVYSASTCSIVDSICGMLHCSMPHRPLTGQVFPVGNSTCYSPPRTDTGSSGIRNGIFVPDGVACGSQAMCVNSECQAVSKFACLNCPDCHGNGNLTKAKLCYCKPGFAPPDCNSTGCGGSTTSQYVCDITKHLPTPVPTSVPTPVPTHVSTPVPTPVPTHVPPPSGPLTTTVIIIIAAIAGTVVLAAIGGVVGYLIHKNRTGTHGKGKQDIYPPAIDINSYEGDLNIRDRPLPTNPGYQVNHSGYFWGQKAGGTNEEPEEDYYAVIVAEATGK